MGKRNVAVQPGRVELGIAGRDDGETVEIGRDQLPVDTLSRRAAGQDRLAIEQPM